MRLKNEDPFSRWQADLSDFKAALGHGPVDLYEEDPNAGCDRPGQP